MATFGRTTIGGTTANQGANFAQVTGPFTLSESGTVTSISMYLDSGGATASQQWTCLIYDDSAGVPNNLKVTSAEVVIAAGAAAAWVDFAVSPGVALTAGTYWVGFEAGVTSAQVFFHFDVLTPGRSYVANTYPTAPNPFGTASTDTDAFSAYATYTPTAVSPLSRVAMAPYLPN
jgi:hypothetical protein